MQEWQTQKRGAHAREKPCSKSWDLEVAAKRRLEYAIAAGDDLESIQRYIEAENPKAAARVSRTS